VNVAGPYTITRCVIAGNTNNCRSGSVGGGLHVQNSAPLSISNTVIKNNYVNGAGGGVHLRNIQNVDIRGCDISGNTALNYGGGIYTSSREYISNCLFANCTITGNYALKYGGGIYISTGTNLIDFQNCLIAGNTAMGSGTTYGGGIFMDSSVASIDNCTIAGNSAKTAGGGIYASIAIANPIKNCIIYNNTASANKDIELAAPESAYSFFYSCAGSMILPPGQGNHTNNPGFVGADDFHLSVNSSCVNTGSNALWMTGAVDLDGRDRIDRFSKLVDMGCYECLPQGVMFNLR
jgi:predicted outer membrane repeat protein